MENGQVVHIVLDHHPVTAGNVETHKHIQPVVRTRPSPNAKYTRRTPPLPKTPFLAETM